MCRRLILALTLLLGARVGAFETPPPANDRPCGTRSTPLATYDHVAWIWFENHGYGEIVGNPGAPYINNRLIPSCGLATNYRSLAHPSLPNYIAATSGVPLGELGPLRHDCNATGACFTRATSIFAQAPSWGAYEESMPRPCTHWFTGPYAASHNPAVYYRGLEGCAAHDLNLGALKQALDSDTLPAFAFIMPNMCHSMHTCAVSAGDAWLRKIIRRITASEAYRRGTMAVFVTFDESEKNESDGRVATFVVSPSTPPGTRSHESFTHYSLLRTTEEMLGVEPPLGQAARAQSMRAAFNL